MQILIRGHHNIDILPCHPAVSYWQRSLLPALGFVYDEKKTEAFIYGTVNNISVFACFMYSSIMK
jgi:hypothetical protein